MILVLAGTLPRTLFMHMAPSLPPSRYRDLGLLTWAPAASGPLHPNLNSPFPPALVAYQWHCDNPSPQVILRN